VECNVTHARGLFAGARALLVDLDGTLVDSSAPVRRAWTAFARRHHLDSETVLAAAQGRPSRETVKLFSPPADHEREAARLEHAETTDTQGTRPLPGAAEVLATTRPLAIVTSGSARLMAVRLQAAGLSVPPCAITADDVTEGKPHPACFTLGGRLLGVPPTHCLALEDSPAGIDAARAAGIPVIALRTTHTDAELGAANEIVDDLSALV
jgi:sugar-phosphatase